MFGSDFSMLPSLANPGKILGVSYGAHAADSGLDWPEDPIVFLRTGCASVVHSEPMVGPRCPVQLDWGASWWRLVGIRARHMSQGRALDAGTGSMAARFAATRYGRRSEHWARTSMEPSVSCRPTRS